MTDTPLRLIPIGSADADLLAIDPEPRTVIGRSALADLVLEHPAVSRTHCRIDATSREDGGRVWLVRDLGSRQGTTVNGHRLEPGAPVPLNDRDTLTIGPLVFGVDLSGSGQTIMPTTVFKTDDEKVRAMPAAGKEPLSPRQAEMVADLVAQLVASDEIDGVCQRVADAAVAGSGYSSASVLRSHSGEPELIAHAGPETDGQPSFSSTLLLQAAETREAVFLSGDASSLRSVSVMSLDIRSAVCVPLLTDGTAAVVGWLYLDARGEAPRDSQSAEFFRVLGRVTGMAIGNLQRRAIERRSADLESEARAARAVQQLCQPPLAGRAGPLDYAVVWRPSRYTAGDLFDLIELDDGGVAFCVGDAVGKGLAAGYLASSIVPALRLALVNGFGVAQAVTSLGACLPWHNDGPTRFLTLWLAALEDDQKTLRFVDAGHGHAYLHRAGGAVERIVGIGGPPLGVAPDVTYADGSIELSPGDRLVLLSDGVLELADRDGRQIGDDVFDPPPKAASVSDYAAELVRRADSHCGGLPFQDDATIAVFSLAR